MTRSSREELVLGVTSLVVVVCLSLASLVFLRFGFQLYNILASEGSRADAERTRLEKVFWLTTGTLLVAGCAVLGVGIVFAIEASRYRWRNWTSWLVEMSIFRAIELAYALVVLVALRKLPQDEALAQRSRMGYHSLDSSDPHSSVESFAHKGVPSAASFGPPKLSHPPM